MTRNVLGAVVIITGCTSPVAVGTDAYALMVTDATAYHLIPRSGGGVEATIGYTYSNRTGRAVSIPNCNGYVPPSLEKLVDGVWIWAWNGPGDQCLSAPVTIEAGVQYRDELRAASMGGQRPPDFLFPMPGTYRLVWETLVWSYSYDPSGPPWGVLVRKAQRVSNSFELIEP